jgi:hypothetical protein
MLVADHATLGRMADEFYEIVQLAFTRSNRRQPTQYEKRLLRLCVNDPEFRAALNSVAASGRDLKITICGGNIKFDTGDPSEQAFAM